MVEVHRSEITPEWVYMNRRQFMTGAAALLASSVLSACSQGGPSGSVGTAAAPIPTTSQLPGASSVPITQTTGLSPQSTPHAIQNKDELGSPLTPFATVTGYNNYYEFSLDKEGIGAIAQSFKTRPWQVQVGGLVNKPKTYTIDELLGFSQEERIYRLRCVEAWSMVVPWIGFPLRSLLEAVEPTENAKYVRFQSILSPEDMPGQKDKSFPWPFTEGLRLDEALHDLTILATGLYGKPLQPESGAPLRLVVPWKYGFKCAKAIVKIDLVKEMPPTFWASMNGGEYGFYANVNPDVPHPRWSQATERRIGEVGSRKTLLFNGYEQEVAPLYAGMEPEEELLVCKQTWLKLGVHVASLTPLVTLVWAAWHGQLGPDLVGAATRRTGRYALAWLLLSLAPTAVRVLSGWPGMLRIRRLLGLYALFYALVHFSIFLGLTYAFDLSLALEGVRQSRFILLGGAALLILVSLGITSTSGWMRRLRRNWKHLHRLVYLAAALAALHYLWNFKDTRKTPLLVGGVLVVLLIVRLPPVERLLAQLRRNPDDRRSTEQPRIP